MIIYIGDWIKPVGEDTWLEVRDIADTMTVVVTGGRLIRADEDNIAEALSADEYVDMVTLGSN